MRDPLKRTLTLFLTCSIWTGIMLSPQVSSAQNPVSEKPEAVSASFPGALNPPNRLNPKNDIPIAPRLSGVSQRRGPLREEEIPLYEWDRASLPTVDVDSTRAKADWNAFGGNASHGFSTLQTVSLPLHLQWVYEARQIPSPGFRNGHMVEQQDQLIESITHDYVYHPVIVGDSLFFASSSEEAVFCLSTTTGEEQWRFYTNGAMRNAPVVEKGKLYCASDGGMVYCLDVSDGSVLWEYQAASGNRRAIVQQRPASAWPVWAGPYVQDGIVYAVAGVFPPQGSFAHAINAETGEALWKRSIYYAPSGHLVVHGGRLWVPTGRTAPAELDLYEDGAPFIEKPSLRRAYGGSYLGQMGELLVWGPNDFGVMGIRYKDEHMPMITSSYRDGINSGHVTLLSARSIVGGEGHLFIAREKDILACPANVFTATAEKSMRGYLSGVIRMPGYGKFNLNGCTAGGMDLEQDPVLARNIEQHAAWKIENDNHLTALLLAGSTLLGGGQDLVAAFDAKTGNKLWQQEVEGLASGLAVANGRLYASTDQGKIYQFGDTSGKKRIRPEIKETIAHDEKAASLAKMLLENADIDKGYAVIVGLENGALIHALARNSAFNVLGIDKDLETVNRLRDQLREAGLYGKNVFLRHEAGALNYPLGIGNIVSSESVLANKGLDYSLESVAELIQPYGGICVLSSESTATTLKKERGFAGWELMDISGVGKIAFVKRGSIEGAGEWSHPYADPANTTCSNDKLIETDLALQWIGPPGPRDVPDRHDIPTSPLSKDGKIFITGIQDKMKALDIYNGTLLWEQTIPGITRNAVSHASGTMCVGRDGLFAVNKGQAVMFNTANGEKIHTFPLENPGMHWGYIAESDGLLIGNHQSDQSAEAAARGSGQALRFFMEAKDRRSNPVAGMDLFAFNTRSLERAWHYTGSTILNASIAIGEAKIFFAESRDPKALIVETGLIDMAAFTKSGEIVALDLKSGEEVWRKKLELLSDEPDWIIYYGYAEGVLASYRSYYKDNNLTWQMQGMDATTGEVLWSQYVNNTEMVNEKTGKILWTQYPTRGYVGTYAPLVNAKNALAARPAIVNGKIYILPHFLQATIIILDLKTGVPDSDTRFSMGWQNKGCTPPTASATKLFYRDTSTHMFDIDSHEKFDLTTVTRPSCWISILPVGGVVLIPEASAFCTCGNAFQISSALAPPIPSSGGR